MSIGEPVARLDGPAKVTGAARYAADQHADGQLYAVFVGARIPAGAVERVDSGQAAREPGVVHVLAATDMPAVHPGFAGVDNDLYYDPKCMMLFGDAKESLNKLFAALKA